MTANPKTEDNQKEEIFPLMDYDNLDFSKETENYYDSDTKEMYGPNNIEIKLR